MYTHLPARRRHKKDLSLQQAITQVKRLLSLVSVFDALLILHIKNPSKTMLNILGAYIEGILDLSFRYDYRSSMLGELAEECFDRYIIAKEEFEQNQVFERAREDAGEDSEHLRAIALQNIVSHVNQLASTLLRMQSSEPLSEQDMAHLKKLSNRKRVMNDANIDDLLKLESIASKFAFSTDTADSLRQVYLYAKTSKLLKILKQLKGNSEIDTQGASTVRSQVRSGKTKLRELSGKELTTLERVLRTIKTVIANITSGRFYRQYRQPTIFNAGHNQSRCSDDDVELTSRQATVAGPGVAAAR